uniref:Putative serine carboxypeptidase lysosomal cathepsin a n=1 Tax=Amblyomma cajennense TaxID=34607 RepID=A0A023FMI1_AMBCJ
MSCPRRKSVSSFRGWPSTRGAESAQVPPTPSLPDPRQPLFLTPLINNCSYAEAKSQSQVQIFKYYNITNASAYSGYITVNETTGSNLFFFFVEAENDPDKAPLMLWTPGGPGLSALFAMLLQNGPAEFRADGNLSRREVTIQKNMNVIYLDAPVGAGLSFTQNITGFATKMEDITRDILEFLKQFLQLFKEYENRDFYASGDSYAARYSVALAYDMLNNPSEVVPLKFQGVVGGAGFLAPIFNLSDSSDFLLQMSMLNQEGYAQFKPRFDIMRKLSEEKNITAVKLLLTTIFASETPDFPKTLFQNLTLYNSHASPLYTERPPSMLMSLFLANHSSFKTAIHAGAESTIEYANMTLLERLMGDAMVDITEKVEYVLNNTRVLFYTGQLDALFPTPNSQAYLEKLKWTHSEQYLTASRALWYPYGKEQYDLPISAAGYTKSAGNFTSAVVLGMGHYAGFDTPNQVCHLVMQFIDRKI